MSAPDNASEKASKSLLRKGRLYMLQNSTLHDSPVFCWFWSDPVPWGHGVAWIGAEAISEVVEAGSEPGSGVVAMALARRCMLAQEVCGGPSGPGEGEGDEGHEQSELARVGGSGVLEVEAAGPGISEQTSMARRLRQISMAVRGATLVTTISQSPLSGFATTLRRGGGAGKCAR